MGKPVSGFDNNKSGIPYWRKNDPPESEYVLTRCGANHLMIVPISLLGLRCHVCVGQPGPFVPPNQYPCVHCGAFPRDHAERSCLFSPTEFKPMTWAELEASVSR